MDKTIELDDDLIKAAQEATGETDERAAVEGVLRNALPKSKAPYKSMFDLIGKIDIREDYDYKAMRAGDATSD